MATEKGKEGYRRTLVRCSTAHPGTLDSSARVRLDFPHHMELLLAGCSASVLLETKMTGKCPFLHGEGGNEEKKKTDM